MPQKTKSSKSFRYVPPKMRRAQELYDKEADTLSEPSGVYFIFDGEFIKIGVSEKIISRLSELQTGNARRLVLLGYLEGGVELEQRLHLRFNHLRRNGEWFQDDAKIRTFITSSCREYSTPQEVKRLDMLAEKALEDGDLETARQATLDALSIMMSDKSLLCRQWTLEAFEENLPEWNKLLADAGIDSVAWFNTFFADTEKAKRFLHARKIDQISCALSYLEYYKEVQR